MEKETMTKRSPKNRKEFSKDYQPSGEAKSAGKRKRRLLKEILALMFICPKSAKIKRLAAEYLGIQETNITIEDMLHFRQIERAVSKSNTFAYMAVMDRAFGKPKYSEEDIPRKIIVTIKK